MAEYINLPCVVCGKEFDENSDVVVCPVCGTPHHRDCYKQIGHCGNIEWHAQNKFFDPELAKAEAEGEAKQKHQDTQNTKTENTDNSPEIICRRCGHKNSAGTIFCANCGFPVSNGFGTAAAGGPSQRGFSAGFGAMPFTPPNPNEDFDGIEGWKLAAVVKENQFSFMPKFMLFAKKSVKVSFNFCACLFSPLYFLYRKMYLWGILGLIIELICGIPNAIYMMTNQYLSKAMDVTVTYGLNLTVEQINSLATINYFASIVSLAVSILSGIFANYLYYLKCKKTAKHINEKASSKQEFLTLADKKGGVNRVIIIIYMALTVILSSGLSLIIANGMLK